MNLDQIVASAIAGRDEYKLAPFFYFSLGSVEAIEYRYGVFRDLENENLLGRVRSFAREMRNMREHLEQAGKLRYKLQKQSWTLDAIEIYCAAVRRLAESLGETAFQSSGFIRFGDFVQTHTASEAFMALESGAQELRAELSRIQYSLHIDGARITVSREEPPEDYGAEVLRTFEKFKQTEAKQYRFEFRDYPDMNHVEKAILGIVADLFPEAFSKLDEFCSTNGTYVDPVIARFDREVQFYMAAIDYWGPLRAAGLSCCYPQVSDRSKDICAHETCDLALASKLLRERSPVVTNDFFLRGAERIIVVSGPNQGGKTTFARTFGQLHHLASIGFPVAGREARLFVFDHLFTHFETEEDVRDLRGKLEKDLVRIHEILESATPSCIVIMNESFQSTTLKDAVLLSRRIMQRLIDLDLLCVSVTFLDELASLGPSTVSMLSTVDSDNPAIRTFKVVRKPADGLAHAAAIADKYRLSHASVMARLSRKQPGGIR